MEEKLHWKIHLFTAPEEEVALRSSVSLAGASSRLCILQAEPEPSVSLLCQKSQTVWLGVARGDGQDEGTDHTFTFVSDCCLVWATLRWERLNWCCASTPSPAASSLCLSTSNLNSLHRPNVVFACLLKCFSLEAGSLLVSFYGCWGR